MKPLILKNKSGEKKRPSKVYLDIIFDEGTKIMLYFLGILLALSSSNIPKWKSITLITGYVVIVGYQHYRKKKTETMWTMLSFFILMLIFGIIFLLS